VTTTGTPPITTVERRGIEYIPLPQRWGTPGGLFWMWAGAIWNVEFLVYGVLGIVVFGLSVHPGRRRDRGRPRLVPAERPRQPPGPARGNDMHRHQQGAVRPRGQSGASLFNWVTQVGLSCPHQPS